jgi:hypothetical protein
MGLHVQRVLIKEQVKVVNEIIEKFEPIVDKIKNKRVLSNTTPDELSGGITSIIKYVEPGYNRALFITWDKDPISKEHYIFRLEITEKYDNARPVILVDKKFINKNKSGEYPIDKYISMFIEGITDK